MSRRFYEKDGNLEYLNGRTVAIIGYGSQGHAHALNLRDSGVDVVVSEAPGSPSWAKAEAAGLKVMTTAEAAKVGNVIMILVPDTIQAAVYNKDIAPHMTPGKTLMFAHGFNIHFKQIAPPPDIDVTMIAPKAPGHRVRELYTEGVGVALASISDNGDCAPVQVVQISVFFVESSRHYMLQMCSKCGADPLVRSRPPGRPHFSVNCLFHLGPCLSRHGRLQP